MIGEKSGINYEVVERSGSLFGQENCLYNKEVDTITTCLMCFDSTTVCNYWRIP
jgi:hypothetical protein